VGKGLKSHPKDVQNRLLKIKNLLKFFPEIIIKPKRQKMQSKCQKPSQEEQINTRERNQSLLLKIL